LPDHSHYSTQNTGYCEHCGQPLPAVPATLTYGTQRVNRVGLAVTVLLHLLLVAVYLFKPETETTSAPPAGGAMVYVNPIAEQPKPQEPRKQVTKPITKKAAPPPKIERLPDTITLPNEKPVKLAEEPPRELEPDPEPEVEEMDMSARIAKRRQERGQSEEPAVESEAARGTRNALANIAAANGRSKGDDRNDTGGVFSVTDKSFSSAQLKFRGWNPNFKRRWLQQVNVELGGEKDIETAIVKKMVELIRKEKTGDFDWDSHRLQRVVRMSARVQDTAELEAFLFKEMFPEYRTGR
jgi:type IV secretory pathway VirB10-like protein